MPRKHTSAPFVAAGVSLLLLVFAGSVCTTGAQDAPAGDSSGATSGSDNGPRLTDTDGTTRGSGTQDRTPGWRPKKAGDNKPQPTNPLLDSQRRTEPVPMQPRPMTLPDYRTQLDPQTQREQTPDEKKLAVFGYNYFEPARQMIDARRVYVEAILTGRTPAQVRRDQERRKKEQEAAAGKTEPPAPKRPTADEQLADRAPTVEEIDAVASLSDAQKLDLLLRQRDDKLTAAEKRKYRLFLYAPKPTAPPDEDLRPTQDEIDAVSALTDQQKQDLIARRNAGTLTADDKRKYRAFLYPIRRRTDTGSGLGSGADADTSSGQDSGLDTGTMDLSGIADESDNLTDAMRMDLLLRQRKGTLTDVDKRRYRRFLNPTGASAGSRLAPTQPRPEDAGVPRDDTRSPSDSQSDRRDWQPEQDASIDAYRQIADPMAQMLRNVTASAPASYQLSGGDSVTLRYWSPTLEARELKLKVDPSGAVNVPAVGRVVLRGQTTEQAEAALRQRLRLMYRNADISITLNELRTIPVTVSGESYYPGTFTVPAVVTALNMIYATGGPTEDGSLRRIEVRRGGTLVGTVDLYKFLLTGDQTFDIPLQAGDVIYVPGHLAEVRVDGEVRRPAVYELADTETLQDALRYAGGIKPSGVGQRVQVSTVKPGAARLLKDVDASDVSAAKSVAMYDGDAVDVFSVRKTVMNKVMVEGAVDQPGEYAISEGMTVADLVERARGLVSDAYPTLAHLYRYNPDNTLTLVPINLEKALARDATANVALHRWDRLTVYTRQEIAWTGQREVTVRGAVRKPGIYYLSNNMHVKDLLVVAGGTLPEAYTQRAVLLHQRPDGSYAYDYVDLTRAIQGDPQANVAVDDRDILAVYRPQEARFTPEHTFNIQGEVVTPGVYPRGENMRLSDALAIAGGRTARAGDRVMVAHARQDESATPSVAMYDGSGAVSPNPTIEDGDVITLQGRGDYQDKPYVVTVTGAVARPGPVILRGSKQHLTDVIKEAGGLKPEAYPEGAEFYRNPDLLATAGQKQIASVINNLNDMLNRAEYNRELAKSDLERLKALGGATRSQAPLAIPGLTATPDAGPNLAATQGANSLFTRDLVSPPRMLNTEELEPKGNVAVNLADAVRHPGGDDDIVMVDGDTVTVPERPTTVQVVGAVTHARAVLYHAGSSVSYYIDQAGGYAPDAARDRELVIRVGGGLTPLNKVRTLQPGDVILVPTHVLAAKIAGKSNDWDSIFRSLTSSALVFFVAKKLIGF